MIRILGNCRWKLVIAGGLSLIGTVSDFSKPLLAQILPDTTLGNEQSVLTPGGQGVAHIEGGALRDSNLFHSFFDFNIADLQRVYFTNPGGVSNILTRVTGSQSSQILGTLGVDGPANLFLINPNGIYFGPNARLDLRGSFAASTAESLTFPDGQRFSATHPEAPPLLTMSVPVGMQYGSTQSSTVVNAGLLQVGQDLTLLGISVTSTGQLIAPNGKVTIEAVSGDIAVRQLTAQTTTLSATNNLDLIESHLTTTGDLTLLAENTVRIRDSAANPFIAQANGKLLVQGNQAVDIFALNHPDSGLFSGGDMVLRSATPVSGDAHYWSGGSFRIETLTDGLGTLSSPHDPIIRASGDVTFDSYIGESLHILAGGSVTIPNSITITGTDTLANSIVENVTLSDGKTVVSINGSMEPTLDIRAGTTAFGVPGIVGNLTSFTPNPPGAGTSPIGTNITIGNVSNLGGTVFLTNQYFPNSTLSSGDIEITRSINTFSPIGNSGSVTLDSRSNIKLTDNGYIETSNLPLSTGNAGSIIILAKDTVSLTNETNFIFSTTRGSGRSGDITINANSVLVENGAAISSTTAGTGQGGILTINASTVKLNNESSNGSVGSGLYTATVGSGNGGKLSVNTDHLIIQDGAQISAAITSTGRGADVFITARFIEVSGAAPISKFPSRIGTVTQGNGTAGDLRIETERLSILDGASVATGTEDVFGNNGQAGNLSVFASDSIQVVGDRISAVGDVLSSALQTDTVGSGRGGDLSIATRKLTVQDGALVITSTLGEGRAGNLTITGIPQPVGNLPATNLELVELSGIYKNGPNRTTLTTLTVGTGDAGNLTISTNRLVIQNGAGISTDTLDGGKGGNLSITAPESVELIGVGANGLLFNNDILSNPAFSLLNSDLLQSLLNSPVIPSALSAETLGTSNAGNIEINTGRLIIRDGAAISTATAGTGQAGNLTINAKDSVEVLGSAPGDFFPSGIITATLVSGDAGSVTINTGRFVAREGGGVVTSTLSQGKGGNIVLNASNSVELSGTSPDGFISGLFLDTLSSGEAGALLINTDRLTVQNEAQATVSSEGTANAGNLSISARNILLENEGKLIAETTSTNGGNINLQVGELLQLRRNSLISTTAGISGAGGDGGNITIAAKFIIAPPLENSDIKANAFDGSGGRVDINTNYIFGMVLRSRSDLVRLLGTTDPRQLDPIRLQTNDITAISQNNPSLNGQVVVTTPGVDPSRGLAPPPTQPGIANLAQTCPQAGQANRNQFINSQRGGLSPNPAEALTSGEVWHDRRTTQPPQAEAVEVPTNLPEASDEEAQGWVKGAPGKVILSSQVNQPVTSSHLSQTSSSCHAQ